MSINSRSDLGFSKMESKTSDSAFPKMPIRRDLRARRSSSCKHPISKCSYLHVRVSEGDIELDLQEVSHNHINMVKCRMWMVSGSKSKVRLNPIFDVNVALANLSYRRPFTRTYYNFCSRSEAEIYKYFASAPAPILERIQAVRRTPPHLSLLAQAKAKYSQRNHGALNGWGHGKQSNE